MTIIRVINKNRFNEMCDSGDKGLLLHAVKGTAPDKKVAKWKKPEPKYSIPNNPNLTEKDKKKLESIVHAETKAYLKSRNIWFMRINTEGLDRGDYTQTNPNAGFSDFMIFYSGFVIYAEAKRPYRAAYSEAQGDFLAHAYKAYQVAGLYSSLDELKSLLTQAETKILVRPDVVHAKNLPPFLDLRGIA